MSHDNIENLFIMAGKAGDKKLVKESLLIEQGTFPEKVLAKKLKIFKLDDRFTDFAVMLIAHYSKGNPAFVQLLALDALENIDGVINIKELAKLWHKAVPTVNDPKFISRWQMQKTKQNITVPLDNLVDSKPFWQAIASKKASYEDACRIFRIPDCDKIPGVITCPQCSSIIAVTAEKCPNCKDNDGNSDEIFRGYVYNQAGERSAGLILHEPIYVWLFILLNMPYYPRVSVIGKDDNKEVEAIDKKITYPQEVVDLFAEHGWEETILLSKITLLNNRGQHEE